MKITQRMAVYLPSGERVGTAIIDRGKFINLYIEHYNPGETRFVLGADVPRDSLMIPPIE